jgi:ABC-type phosphate transport system auxiliary subunit
MPDPGLDQERQALIHRRRELSRELEALASPSAPARHSELQARREQIEVELQEIEADLADFKLDERNIASMEGRE